MGIFSRTVKEMYEPFVMPQEHGNRMDVRWASLTDQQGRGLLIMGMPHLNVSATRITPSDMADADHTHELDRSGDVVLHLDHEISGVDGRGYRAKTKSYTWTVALRPFVKKEDNATELSRRRLPLSDRSELRQF
jgi:hypothetical protein